MTTTGTVYLVGAGPGDPGLITVKGMALLRQAEVVIYDRLAPAALLNEARHDAELINVGKMPRQHQLEQQQINALMIDRARAGRMVVRLKGGDPFVFGRGGEEALACREAGVPFVVVPGISSALAVPAYAGIPVTHRGLSSSFAVFSGHENPQSASVDYAALARIETLVILMGVSHLPAIAERLMSEGMRDDTPVVCIEQGTTDQQRVVEGTLATIAAQAAEANLQAPAIIVIGQVASLRAAGLCWLL